MKTFANLKHGDKVVDKTDGMVMTYYKDKEGNEYLTSELSAWDLWQFDPKDFKRYKGGKGEI